jgi:hypothetical protein
MDERRKREKYESSEVRTERDWRMAIEGNNSPLNFNGFFY